MVTLDIFYVLKTNWKLSFLFFLRVGLVPISWGLVQLIELSGVFFFAVVLTSEPPKAGQLCERGQDFT